MLGVMARLPSQSVRGNWSGNYFVLWLRCKSGATPSIICLTGFWCRGICEASLAYDGYVEITLYIQNENGYIILIIN